MPIALVANDDGIDCGYLHALADAMSTRFEVYVAAPKHEQSWAGRSFSRRGKIEVIERPDLRWPAWSIDGTPSDAVNIALGTPMPKRPDIVVPVLMWASMSPSHWLWRRGQAAAFEGSSGATVLQPSLKLLIGTF